MITFKPLFHTLIDRGLKKKDLYSVIPPATLARMGRDDQGISIGVINRACAFLDVPLSAVVDYVPDRE